MDKTTKFYKVTKAIIEGYDKKYKDVKPSVVAKEFDVPSGFAGNVIRTIQIMKGEDK